MAHLFHYTQFYTAAANNQTSNHEPRIPVLASRVQLSASVDAGVLKFRHTTPNYLTDDVLYCRPVQV